MGPKHGQGLLPLASTWPPTPKARKISCGRLSLVTGAALLIVISAVSTLTAMAWLSDGLADVNDEVPKPLATRLAAAARPFKRMQNALLRRIEDPGGNASCVDKDSECIGWEERGECKSNPGFMSVQCARSCGLCTATEAKFDPNCDDKSSFCGQWAAVGECGAWPTGLESALLASACVRARRACASCQPTAASLGVPRLADSNPSYMRVNCPVTCHLCQSRACHDVNRTRCQDEASVGACRREPERMFDECRWACKWCAMDTGSRCRRASDLQPAARKGSLDYMFRRASAPIHAHLRPIVHSRDPWVVSFDTFLSDEEADSVIQVGGRGGWGRSMAGDGVQAVRTSSTAWCDHKTCGADPVLASIRKRIANLTLVPERNAEHLQVLKYETGQFYKTHHDQNSPTTSAWGPRMYTFFMYLNDAPGGGETHFPQLNISIKPKRGRALLWPSVLDADPNERDFRTEHEAVTVTEGRKCAATYWLHSHANCDRTQFLKTTAYAHLCLKTLLARSV